MTNIQFMIYILFVTTNLKPEIIFTYLILSYKCTNGFFVYHGLREGKAILYQGLEYRTPTEIYNLRCESTGVA
jgi:hypothetical protein